MGALKDRFERKESRSTFGSGREVGFSAVVAALDLLDAETLSAVLGVSKVSCPVFQFWPCLTCRSHFSLSGRNHICNNSHFIGLLEPRLGLGDALRACVRACVRACARVCVAHPLSTRLGLRRAAGAGLPQMFGHERAPGFSRRRGASGFERIGSPQ